MKPNTLLSISILVILALTLAACAGSDQAQNVFQVSVKDEFKFDPATLTVKPGQEVTITFDNNGSVEHSFNILKASASLDHLMEEVGDEEHMDEELVMDMHGVAAGESISKTFTAPPEAGDYTIACLVPGHVEAGMTGTLKVAP